MASMDKTSCCTALPRKCLLRMSYIATASRQGLPMMRLLQERISACFGLLNQAGRGSAQVRSAGLHNEVRASPRATSWDAWVPPQTNRRINEEHVQTFNQTRTKPRKPKHIHQAAAGRSGACREVRSLEPAVKVEGSQGIGRQKHGVMSSTCHDKTRGQAKLQGPRVGRRNKKDLLLAEEVRRLRA